MEERICLQSWIGAFLLNEYESQDVKTQIKAGWYNWSCEEKLLAKKTKRIGDIIKKIKEGGKIDLCNWNVWFKNNRPYKGHLYDDFRFANLETGEVQFTVQIDCCWNKHKYCVYGRTFDGIGHWDKPLFETDYIKELIAWFNTSWNH